MLLTEILTHMSAFWVVMCYMFMYYRFYIHWTSWG